MRFRSPAGKTSLAATVAGTADFLNSYSYDALNRLTTETQAQQAGGNTVAAKRVNFAYNADGQYTSISRYADTTGTNLVATSTYGYNGVGSATSLSYDKGGTNFAAYTWSYDNDQRLTSDSLPDGTDSFTYDAASQITAATHSYQTNENYSYDSNGNRTNTGYSTGTNNQLSSDGTYNYTYDNNGNLTQKTAISGGAYTTYTWDYHNRLTDVSNYTSGGTLTQHVHYTYDVNDRLIGRQVDPTGGGTYTSAQRFVYDGDNIVLAFDGSSTLTDRLLPLPLGEGRGEGGATPTLADEKASGTVNWYFTDNQGTVRDVAQYNAGTNTTSVVDHLKFDSFGNITAQSNSANQPLFAYTGQFLDASTGLYWYHARWYDPHTGRFISQDPSGFGAGDFDLYRYVGNDPMNTTDPSGMVPSSRQPVPTQPPPTSGPSSSSLYPPGSDKPIPPQPPQAPPSEGPTKPKLSRESGFDYEMGPEGGDNPKPGEDPPPKGPPAGFADRLKDIMKEIASLVKFNITISWGVKQSQAKIEAEFRARMIDYQNKLDEWKASWEEYNEKALEYNEAARIYSLRYHAWLLSQPTPWYKPSPKDDSIPIIPVPP